MAIKIPFVADVVDFLRGTRDAEEALEDVDSALDDLGRNRSTENLDDDFTGLAREAEATAEKIETSFSDAFDKLKAEGKTATKSVKGDVDDVGHKGAASLKEFRDEAKQNVAESVSSFTGSAESAVDAIQSTFGGLVSALGPAGVLGATAAAAGIGLARGLFEKAKEQAEELREAIGGVFDELRENEGTLTAAFQEDQMADLIRDAERFEEVFGTDVPTAMKNLGSDFGVVMAGLTGDTKDVAAAQEAVMRTWEAAAAAGQTYVDENGNVMLRNVELEKSLGRVSIALGRQKEAFTGGLTANQAFSEAQAALQVPTQDSAEAIKEENDELAENARLKGDAAEAGWDMADALDAVNVKTKEGKATLNENTKAGRDNAREVKKAMDAINEWAAAQVDAGADVKATNAKLREQEDALVRKIMPAFGGSEAKAREYIRTLGGIPRKKETDVEVSDNGTAAHTQEQIDNIKSSGVPVPVSPDMGGFDREVAKYLSGKKYYVRVAPRAGKNAMT